MFCSTLAPDPVYEAVKEALAAELVPIIWWFITHCKLVEDDSAGQPPLSPPTTTPLSPSIASTSDGESAQPPPLELPRREEMLDAQELASSLAASDAGASTTSTQSDGGLTVISVQAFTPLLGTLLLSPHTLVSGPARYAVVELLRRLRRADQVEDEERASMSSSEGSSNDMQVDGQEARRMASPTPSLSKLTGVLSSTYQDAKAKKVERGWLTLATCTLLTANAPPTIGHLYRFATREELENAATRRGLAEALDKAAVMRESALKSCIFVGVPRTILSLANLHETIEDDVRNGLRKASVRYAPTQS
ncbi:hypothetical protein NUW54_g13919 [Trametes sanguinea]|uniref:Uncharacterized protein n=1 Tax=Trametes sanguinea TaxID=158606 RepID=A0ACC1MIF5_9APHY|nr:hypothetical protein NUW54_g13919 [Trametes sanguinea]